MIKFFIVQSQIALFLTTLDTRKMLNLARAIQEASDDLLDSDPLVLPFPADAPSEFPKLRLNSNDRHWVFQVAGTRLDFFYERSSSQQEMEAFDEIVDKQAQIYGNIWQILQKQYNASGNRIGVIGKFGSSPENAIQILKSRFITPSDAPDQHQLQLHALHKMPLGGVEINRWTRCTATKSALEGGSEGSLRVEIDINTFPDQHFDLTPAKILNFTDNAKGLILDTMTSLFEDNSSVRKVF